jgi:hypothetical protein
MNGPVLIASVSSISWRSAYSHQLLGGMISDTQSEIGFNHMKTTPNQLRHFNQLLSIQTLIGLMISSDA